MGEVYRGHDTNLNRDVALKILPAVFALDSSRLARFKREAQVLASLNHPNIGAIYGLEESGGVQVLVLELVEGPTLADRIDEGPVPVDEALPIAKQIAAALQTAHEQSVIHRDLKPANIKLRPDGVVKVLDFGLAKALDPASASSTNATISAARLPQATEPGVILGTAAYMSPEQARGNPVDKRADTWAFGCVLFEMLTGTRAFEGETMSDTLANVLKNQPDWNALPPSLPPPIRTLIQRCLDKDRARRVTAAATIAYVLEEITLGTDAGDTMPAITRTEVIPALAASTHSNCTRGHPGRRLGSLEPPACAASAGHHTLCSLDVRRAADHRRPPSDRRFAGWIAAGVLQQRPAISSRPVRLRPACHRVSRYYHRTNCIFA
jgi:serine/threonine protein kinase